MVGIIEALAPERLRLVDAQQAQAAEFPKDFMGRPDAGLLPVLGVGVHLGLDESGHGIADRAMLFRQPHGLRPPRMVFYAPSVSPPGGLRGPLN